MPIDTLHPEYESNITLWTRCRDVADTGGEAVKDGGETYLPKLDGQNRSEYENYKMRAYFYGAAKRSVDAYNGLVFRKDPTITAPQVAAVEALLRDVTLTGVDSTRFAQDVFDEVVKVGRVGVYCALPSGGTARARAYLTHYRAEDITNWSHEFTPDGWKLTRVVLRESKMIQGEDPYTLEEQTSYRELHLDDGSFGVRLWHEEETERNKHQWVAEELPPPQVRGARLDHIPFQFINSAQITAAVDTPPILSLVDANLHHYRLQADYNHGLHFCGLPTPWVAGFPADSQLRIGSATAWVTESTDARAGMLEFTGQGLNPLKDAIEQIVGYMASLGARLLEQDRRAVEAAETHRIRQSREESTVASIAQVVSSGLSRPLTWLLQMSAIAGEAQIDLNTDLVDAHIEPAQLRELVGAWQAGAMSFDTLYYNLRQGELTRPDVTAEEEKELIEIDNPLLAVGGADGDGDGIIQE